MKTTVVPAQVTTVEDKIAGNLSVTQMFLLTAPVFLGGGLFAFFPPLMTLTPLKLTFVSLLTLICLVLAIRIKGKILMVWAITITRYNLRPRYYVFNKNDIHLRLNVPRFKTPNKSVLKPVPSTSKSKRFIPIPTAEIVRLETAVADPRAKFHFKTTRKGSLRVYIKQIK